METERLSKTADDDNYESSFKKFKLDNFPQRNMLPHKQTTFKTTASTQSCPMLQTVAYHAKS